MHETFYNNNCALFSCLDATFSILVHKCIDLCATGSGYALIAAFSDLQLRLTHCDKMSSTSMDIEQNNDSDTCLDSPSDSVYVKTPKTVFTPKQLCYLEEMFYKKQFPDSKEKLQIAKHLNLTFRNVQVNITIT